jgi:hypothetical protein
VRKYLAMPINYKKTIIIYVIARWAIEIFLNISMILFNEASWSYFYLLFFFSLGYSLLLGGVFFGLTYFSCSLKNKAYFVSTTSLGVGGIISLICHSSGLLLKAPDYYFFMIVPEILYLALILSALLVFYKIAGKNPKI